ncbi:MAG: class I SAM-dependent methyltransferase [Alphaproteobacteria bacterium]|nr:class I SAM-dependent methyltransferase [Alphaproteobacteria bacterium]
MPDIEWNKATFAGSFDWRQTGGEEWSDPWGGSESQWFGSLYPRLHRVLPAGAILEIAPGFGRWTKFLLPACRMYVGVDLSHECVAACSQRFRDAGHARFVKNDGSSLADVSDGKFDLVFSFDALVHVERDVMENYIRQILRKLVPSGLAFLHHSNVAALPADVEKRGARGASVSGDIVLNIVDREGGKALIQERICWGQPSSELLDCITIFGRHEHPYGASPIVTDNRRFMEEAVIIRETHAPYCQIPATPLADCQGRPPLYDWARR